MVDLAGLLKVLRMRSLATPEGKRALLSKVNSRERAPSPIPRE